MSVKIKGTEGLTVSQLQNEIAQGGTFVMYQYCVSLILITFRRPSAIYFIPAGQSRISKGLPFTFISLFLGWWGIPWGPIYTIGSFITNFKGGKDLTESVMGSLLLTEPQNQEAIAAA